MLRVTGLSLLLGLAALVAMLYTIFLPPGTDQPAASSLHWTPTPGDGVNTQPISLNEHGEAVLVFQQTSFEASQFAYLYLALQNSNSQLTPPSVTLNWTSSRDAQAPRSYTLETPSYDSLWLATGELRGWEGTITKFSLALAGGPDQPLEIDDIALHPPKLEYQLRAIHSDLTAFVRWNRSSMNSHTGVRDTSSFYPTILFAAFWLASLAVYVLLTLVVNRIRFQWEVIGLVTLGAWIALDMTWQVQLVQQAANTRDTFAGKSTTEKLMVGPDAQLYAFVDAAKEKITQDNARVFAASSDDYTGLRAAYYLYPNNAFWSLKRDELPPRYFLRSGDYIALLNPNNADTNLSANVLTLPRGELLVDTLLSMPAGTLVKVQ
ncbi:MAG: hypothetical protein AB8C02_14920 [Halioglobus sp.]